MSTTISSSSAPGENAGVDRSLQYAPWARRRRVVVLPSPLALLDQFMAAMIRAYPIALVNFILVCLACFGGAVLMLTLRNGL